MRMCPIWTPATAMIKAAGLHFRAVRAYAEEYAAAPYACADTQAACRRFLDDLEDPRWDFDSTLPEFLILSIQTLFVHQQGEALDGVPLRNRPFLLQPWELFICYNIGGFYLAGTQIRRFQEAFLMLARKNGKTPFATALMWTLGLWYAPSGSKIKTVAGSLQQNMEGFGFLRYNLHRMGMTLREDPAHGLRELDSSLGHSYSGQIGDGSIEFSALAYKPDIFDAFNANLIHLDELELYRNSTPYTRLKDATIAYSNKLILATTTAGDDGTGFCAQRVLYCSKVVQGKITGPDADRLFVFIARAPQDDRGEVDYLNPAVHRMANPSWGVTIRPEDIEASALQAQNDPQTRKEFLSRRLNVFVSSLRAYFNLDSFRASDRQYNWTLEELARLPVRWYGGSDLARLHDLTAACLVGEYKDVLIIIPHCWFPITAAAIKADQDQIPLFGWKDDGWLDMSNDRSTNLAEPVKWYQARRAGGFKITQVGHDRKFAPEYVTLMKKAGFKVVDQPQLHYLKSQGFRHIEKKANNGLLYYCHAEPFEYCVGNVYAVEKEDDVAVYDKIDDTLRIDVFDAAVFATVRMLIHSGDPAAVGAARLMASLTPKED